MAQLTVVREKLYDSLNKLKERYAVSDKDMFIIVSEYTDRTAIEKMEDNEIGRH
jgi:hypothetical protein